MNIQRKVCQILYSGLGGHATVAFAFTDASKKQSKIKNHMLFYGVEQTKEEYVRKCKTDQILYDSVLKKKGLDLTSFSNVFFALKRQRPSVVILHSINLIGIVFIAKIFFGFKIIAVEHQSNQLKGKSEWLFSWLCMILANKVIYLTEAYKNEVQRKFPVFFANKKVHVIPNGIDVDYFNPNEGQHQEVIKMGMISRINELKDHKTLINAFATLNRKDILLIIAGEGPTLNSLKQLTQTLNMQDNVLFPGLLEGNAVLEFFKEIDIYIHTSFGETMSTAIMQAMSCGLPIIASDVDGIKNMLIHSQTALLVPASNTEQLASAIAELTLNKEKAHLLGVRARQYAVEHFSNEKMFESYAAILF